ncbi:MAG: arsenate reductase family protein [Lachnospiraceae bacterium]|nr:arsenate reductase family protein [Lachnospiraceae bacterium]
MYLFLEYPKCSTCQKAKKWLDEHKVVYTDRHIVENNPKEEELKDWIEKSGMPIKKFFNTSGLIYKSLGLKDKISEMTFEEQVELLASNGMLVKRPIIIGENTVLVGFKEIEWRKLSNT